MGAVPADHSGLNRARADAAESARRREADQIILGEVDFITSALRDLRTNDRFAQRLRDTLREHG